MGVVHYTIPDELHRRAKQAAASQGLTFRAFLVECLRVGSDVELDDDAYPSQHGATAGGG